MATSTERVRRYRRHKADDHSLCAPTAPCRPGHLAEIFTPSRGGAELPGELAPPPTTPPPVRSQPPRAERPAAALRSGPFVDTLDDRGRALWLELAGDTLPALPRALLEEACRIADRLDRMHAGLSRRSSLFDIVSDDTGTELTLIVDNGLTAARLHAQTLKALVTEIKTVTSAAPPAKPAPDPALPVAGTSGGVLGDIAAQRAKRHGA